MPDLRILDDFRHITRITRIIEDPDFNGGLGMQFECPKWTFDNYHNVIGEIFQLMEVITLLIKGGKLMEIGNPAENEVFHGKSSVNRGIFDCHIELPEGITVVLPSGNPP